MNLLSAKVMFRGRGSKDDVGNSPAWRTGRSRTPNAEPASQCLCKNWLLEVVFSPEGTYVLKDLTVVSGNKRFGMLLRETCREVPLLWNSPRPLERRRQA
jgi:hypothetical protein